MFLHVEKPGWRSVLVHKEDGTKPCVKKHVDAAMSPYDFLQYVSSWFVIVRDMLLRMRTHALKPCGG